MLLLNDKANISFTLHQKVGNQGRNSEVFFATDNDLNADIVIKRMAKKDFNGSSDYFAESRILYASSHPNVVPIMYACQDKDHIYFALPLYNRDSVKSLMSNGFLTTRDIIRLSIGFLSGLNNIHTKDLIHFDVKPDNILISDSGEALLSDFGLARHTNPSGAAQQNKFYFSHTPPESLNTLNHTRTFDIYQAGVTMYRMCNGDNDFEEQINKFIDINGQFNLQRFQAAIANGQFPNRSKFLPHIPESLRRIIRKAMHVSKYQRYKSVYEMLNALAQLDAPQLDWQYTDGPTGQKWVRKEGNNTIEVEVDPSRQIVAHKETPNTKYRIHKHEGVSINTMEVKELLQKL